MLKKTITFKDLDGNPVTEDFYFMIREKDLAKLELVTKGGFRAYLEEISNEDDPDGEKIIETMEKIIRMSVGHRHEDGKQFVQSPEIADAFMNTDAYSILFMELVLNAEAAAAFVRGIMPEVMQQEIAASGEDAPPWIKEDRDPTEAEFKTMSREQMQEAFVAKSRRKAAETSSENAEGDKE